MAVSESPLKRLLVQASHYGFTSLLTMLAGLVSFPLLTRLFSVADYGVMNLVAATITIVVALGKFGVQHSILRYQSEVSAGKSTYTMVQLVSTTFFGMLATAAVAMLLLAGGVHLAPLSLVGDPRVRWLFTIASLMVITQVIESALVNFLRAEQRTATFMKYQVAKKYLTLGLIVGALLLISRTLTAFYSASVLSEILSVAVLMLVLFRGARAKPALSGFSFPLYRELISFGIPMMIGYEMSGTVLAVGDRYVIEGVIGPTPLGLYSAAYNLCQYVQAVFIASVGQAIMPIYLHLWDEKGVDETSRFITRSLGRYVLFGAPVVAGLAAVGPELLPSLASAKYASAAAILPWVIAGMVVDGSNAMVGAGLFIHRKTRTIMAIVVAGAVLNILLNLVMVPRIGILGSAIATLLSYAFTSLSFTWAGRRLLPVTIPVATILRAGAAAAAMYFAVYRLLPGRHLLSVGVRTALGGLVYVALMGLIDSDARALLQKVWTRLRRGAQA